VGIDRRLLRELVDRLGTPYSSILGIRLEGGSEEEVFKWFLASILFGAPISETSVIKTYRCFEGHRILNPWRILETGWDGLVEVLDEGGYTRYDFKTADKLLEVMRNLVEMYGGRLTRIHELAADARDLEARLRGLGKGLGDVTVGIFLRELRGIWSKARPQPTPLVILAAKNLGIVGGEGPGDSLTQLEAFWAESGIPGRSFVNFETALLRLGKDFCRRGRCGKCPASNVCVAH